MQGYVNEARSSLQAGLARRKSVTDAKSALGLFNRSFPFPQPLFPPPPPPSHHLVTPPLSPLMSIPLSPTPPHPILPCSSPLSFPSSRYFASVRNLCFNGINGPQDSGRHLITSSAPARHCCPAVRQNTGLCGTAFLAKPRPRLPYGSLSRHPLQRYSGYPAVDGGSGAVRAGRTGFLGGASVTCVDSTVHSCLVPWVSRTG